MPETTRLDTLESKISDISTGQAVIKTEVIGISKAILTLVDLRAESLHLIREQETNREHHEEIFIRLRSIEEEKSSCSTDRVAIKKDICKLEKNQRWGVLAVVGAVFAAISPLIKGAFATMFKGGG